MAWVQRINTVIVGVYANQQPGIADEFIPDSDPSVITFVSPPKKVKRTLYDITQSLLALTANQKTNVVNDLTGTTPPKWVQDSGLNSGAIFAVYYTTQTTAMTVSDKQIARLYIVALYVQDNVGYLVSPTFDQTINVPGDQPA